MKGFFVDIVIEYIKCNLPIHIPWILDPLEARDLENLPVSRICQGYRREKKKPYWVVNILLGWCYRWWMIFLPKPEINLKPGPNCSGLGGYRVFSKTQNASQSDTLACQLVRVWKDTLHILCYSLCENLNKHFSWTFLIYVC